jgi:polar amino acid transport system substrate-binding protein
MRPTPLRHVPALALALTAALLAGCGSDSTSSNESPTRDTAAEATSGPSLHDELPEAIRSAGVIVFAGDSHPPYRTVEPGGEITGIDADFQSALAEVLGVDTKTEIIVGLPAALQGMLAGRYDAFNGPVKATADRMQQFDAIVWMTTRTAYVVPADSAVKATEELCGKKVAAITGSVTEGQLTKLSDFCEKSGKPRAELVGLADTNATLLAVKSGRADAAGMTQSAAIDVSSKEKGAFRTVVQTEEQGATLDQLALLTPKDSGLGPVMHKAWQELFDNGDYERIMEKWELTEVSVDEPVLNPTGVS